MRGGRLRHRYFATKVRARRVRFPVHFVDHAFGGEWAFPRLPEFPPSPDYFTERPVEKE